MSKKVLVTGGHGTIGRGLISELRAKGHDVYSVDIEHGEEEVGFSLRTDVRDPRYARCDIGEFRQIERVIRKWGPFDYVYNCAAEFGRWNGEDFYEQLWRSNAVGTKNIIRLQEEHGFRLVHFSSSEVYGDWPGIMAESVMDQYEIRQMNDYAMTKWVNEMQIHNSRQQYGTESVIVRIFNTYGPGEYYSPYRSVNCRFVYCALKGLPWLVFRGYSRTSTYLADSVRTIGNIIDRFVPGETYNIGGQQLHTIEELSDLVIAATGASPELVEYRDAEVLTTRDKRVDTSKAKQHLGHEDSVSLADGVARTVEWMRKTYGL
jgi:dTDP-glucose 4,6-dehydratase